MLRRVSIKNEEVFKEVLPELIKGSLQVEEITLNNKTTILDVLQNQRYRINIQDAFLVKDIACTFEFIYTLTSNNMFGIDFSFVENIALFLLRDLAVRGLAFNINPEQLAEYASKLSKTFNEISKETKVEVRARKVFDYISSANIFRERNGILAYAFLNAIMLKEYGCVLLVDSDATGEELLYMLSEDIKNMEVF